MFVLALLLLGCSGGPQPPGDWVSGDYQFYTLEVEDGCLDGALEALFMPEGPDQEWAFEYPIYLPTPKQTPVTYDVSFREPFVGMSVTVQSTETGIAFEGAVMESVLLNEGTYGDCVATMSVDAQMWSVERGVTSGDAQVSLSNLRGDDGRCPTLDTSPCTVDLTIRADLSAERSGP